MTIRNDVRMHFFVRYLPAGYNNGNYSIIIFMILVCRKRRKLKRECHCIRVKLLKSLYKDIQALSVICFVCTKNEMKTFLTLKRNPGKLAAVIIKESGREAYLYKIFQRSFEYIRFLFFVVKRCNTIVQPERIIHIQIIMFF